MVYLLVYWVYEHMDNAKGYKYLCTPEWSKGNITARHINIQHLLANHKNVVDLMNEMLRV